MNGFFSLFYLLVSVLAATELTIWISGQITAMDAVAKFLAWILLFFSVFYGGFFSLGYFNLLTDLPVVSSFNAFWLSFICLITAQFLVRRNILAYKNCKASLDQLRKSMEGFSFGSSVGQKLTLVTCCVFLLMGLMRITGFPLGYEAQAYHLPIAIHIFQAQSLKVWRVWETVFTHTYPANASIYYGFLLDFIPERLVAASGLLFLILLAVAVYGIARLTAADQSGGLLAAVGMVTIPIVTFPALDAVSDIQGAAFLAVAIYFAIAGRSNERSGIFLSGLAAGLAFGFKSFHLVGATFVCLVALFPALWKASKVSSVAVISQVTRIGLPFLTAFFAMAGFWLVRNYLELGNPLYPVYLQVFDLFGWSKAEDFASIPFGSAQFIWVRSSAEWLVYPWVEWLRVGEEFQKSGPGAFFAATVPVAFLEAMISLIKRDTAQKRVIASLLSGTIFTLVIWWISNAREPRYAIGALVFVVPLVGWTVSRISGRSRTVFEVIAAVCILSSLWMTFARELVFFGQRFIYAKTFSRSDFYQYPKMVDKLPGNSTVVNLAHRTRNYSLYGKQHKNQVVVYSEALRALRAHTSGPDEAADAATLPVSTLRRLGATHLFTEGHPKLVLDGCVRLSEVDKVDKDPVGNPLPKPLILHEIQPCDLMSQGRP